MKFGVLVLVALLAGNAHATPETARSADTPAPLESFVGHYLTGQIGEGVFIEHVGTKAFLTLVTYDSDGQGIWFVMPDGRWQANEALSRSEFTGPVYKVRRGQESPPALQVNPVGNATWYPTGPDTIRFSATIGDNPITRTLQRFRL